MTMAAHLWSLDPATVDTNYKKRHPAEPTLPNTFIWATWTAAGSDYLQKLDAASAAPQDEGLIDISHVRWATMNVVTAIDLCATTMGRLFCGHTGTNEFDLRAFDRKANCGERNQRGGVLSTLMAWVGRKPVKSSRPSPDDLMAALPDAFRDWVTTTLADQRYREVLQRYLGGRMNSRQVSWWDVHEHVSQLLDEVGDWPMIGTPAWCALSDDDPAKLAAIAV